MDAITNPLLNDKIEWVTSAMGVIEKWSFDKLDEPLWKIVYLLTPPTHVMYLNGAYPTKEMAIEAINRVVESAKEAN